MAGMLYLVPTPIGNLGDISIRCRETLEQADFIAAEDTRVTLKLLNHLGIKKSLVSYYEHNKTFKGDKIVQRILDGETCALVSDAGSPAISDPGEDLVKQFSRTQDTFVQIDHFAFDLPKEIFFPLSVLNHLRKCAVDLLYQEKTKTGPVMEKEYHVDCVSLPLVGIQIQEGLSNTNPELADLRYNVTNSYALACLVKLGYKGAMVSLECSLEQTKALVEAFEKRYRSPAPVSVWIYGKRRLMLMNQRWPC